ncbi:genetic competence negative regulator [Bacillus sp. FJAT-44742]|uniref:genetic competence negative regulator n=1 Tax=Bacillus sp. FJAT-44742 TaxID=2014005 RepID=UPI000C234116|nr:genetic competence negative regulator [Bacillus sp. FJAT-44742]
MRLEKITTNKVKVFLTLDDLSERGLEKDDLWNDSPRVKQLFRDMVLEADEVLGFKVEGYLSVEVYALPAQGMIIHLSSEEAPCSFEEMDEDVLELEITMDERPEMLFEYRSFEDIIQLAWRLYDSGITGGQLLFHKERYYIYFHKAETTALSEDTFIAVMSEYGEPSTTSYTLLKEYSSRLLNENAVSEIVSYFSR